MPTELRIPAADGFPLAATLHEPASPARAVTVMAPATAVKRGFYDAFAAYLAQRGHVVLSYDTRGVGGSMPAPPGARLADWGRLDMSGALAWARKERPDLPLALVGHSSGGQLVGMADGAEHVQAVVSVSSQHGDWRLWPMPKRLLRWTQWHVLSPALVPLFGKLPRWALGHELPKGVALEWARWCRSREFLLRDDADGTLRARLASLRVPWLAYSFGDDDYGPHHVHDALLALYPNVALTRRRIDPPSDAPVGHFGFFRRQQAGLWAEAADWVDACLTRPRA